MFPWQRLTDIWVQLLLGNELTTCVVIVQFILHMDTKAPFLKGLSAAIKGFIDG